MDNDNPELEAQQDSRITIKNEDRRAISSIVNAFQASLLRACSNFSVMPDSPGQKYYYFAILSYVVGAIVALYVTLSSIVILTFIILGFFLALVGLIENRFYVIRNRLDRIETKTAWTNIRV